MNKHGSVRRWIAAVSTLLLLLTVMTPFGALAEQNPDGYEEVLRFSRFERETVSGNVGDFIYADWTLADQQPFDITAGHELKNLRLQLKFTLTGPEGQVEMSTTWNRNGWIKVRSQDENGENNYGWWLRSGSTYPLHLHSGENELLIPLVNVPGDGYDVTTTGTINWTKVDRLLMAVQGRDIHNGVSDHKMKVTYAAIVDIGEQPDPAPTIQLPTIFSDQMMIQQGKAQKVWGKGVAGETVDVTLTKQGDTTALQHKSATVGADGKWSVSLDPMAAGYQEYAMTVTSSDGGTVTGRTVVSHILVGEVWVAAGQSNMQMPVGNELYADEYAVQAVQSANGQYIRLYEEPNMPFGSAAQPLDPEDDVPGAYWGAGNNDGDVLAVSAVGYHFAQAMQEKLDIPVGILYTPVGGSVIEAWIPREAVDADAEYKAFLKSLNKYCDENNWPAQPNRQSAFYNQKIGPLKGYNAAGVIWYQGESNENEGDMYDHALALMRRTWNDVFGFTGGENIPFVYTMVEPWITHLEDPQHLAYLAEGMSDAQRDNDADMAMIGIYDLPLYFLDRNGNSSDPIHPRVKEPVGRRFADAAYNLVYDDTGAEYTAPLYQSHTPVDTDADGLNDAIDVTFTHVGDGLDVIDPLYEDDPFGVNKGDGLEVISETDDVHGFAIAGTGGIYVNAKAKIIGKDTVRVWSDGLKNPTNVTYNFVSYYVGGTLKNSLGIPAIPFRSDRSDTAAYWNAQDWTYADANIWTCYTKTVNNSTLNWASFEDAWKVSGGSWSYDPAIKAEGRASVKAAYTPANGTAGIGPVLGMRNVTNQFENFDTVSVAVKNGDARAKTLALNVTSAGKVYTAATVENFAAQAAKQADIPASGDFAVYTFSLRDLTDDKGAAIDDPDAILKNVDDLTFAVGDTAAGTVWVDDVSFGFLYDLNADKSLLKAELQQTVDASLYTAESLAAYQTAKEAAQSVLDDPVATQSQIDRMTQTLKQTRRSLAEISAVATFSKFQKTIEMGHNGIQSIYVDWTFGDNTPIDLTPYDMEQLRLQIRFHLVKPDDVEEVPSVFNNYGFIKLRSADTPGENNYGWLFSTAADNAIKLHSGENQLSLPLVSHAGDGYSILRTGEMDWSQVNRIMMMISSPVMNGRTGEFAVTIEDVKVVDLSVVGAKKDALRTLIAQPVNTSGDADKVAAYNRTKTAAQAMLDDEFATLSDVAAMIGKMQTAIDVLDGAAFTAADKSALRELVDEQLNESRYTPATWKIYAEAKAAAERVLADDYAVQSEVDDAYGDLRMARSGLALKAPLDTARLEELLAETIDLSLYTDTSVQTYQEAIAAGQRLLENDDATQARINNAVKDIEEAKSLLKVKQAGDPTDIRLTFSGNNGTFTSLLYGSQFYTNWHVADGYPASGTAGGGADLSGSADNGANRNLALKATVTFTALGGQTVDFSTAFTQMGFRLRSSQIKGANREAQFYFLRAADAVINDGVIEVEIPLSAITTANIDWADVKELNVFCEVAQAYRTDPNANCQAFTFTLANARIEAMSDLPPAPAVDTAALEQAIAAAEAKLTDDKTYTDASLSALNAALSAAKALGDTATQEQVDAAAQALNAAITGLEEVPAVVTTPGDVDGKDGVTAADALMALQAATGKINLTDEQAAAADVDGKDGVTAADALAILQFATGKITAF